MEGQNKIELEPKHDESSKDKIPLAEAVIVQSNDTLHTGNPSNHGRRDDKILYLGRTPKRIICEFCGHEGVTVAKPFVGPTTHLYALFICCVCVCFFPYHFISADDN